MAGGGDSEGVQPGEREYVAVVRYGDSVDGAVAFVAQGKGGAIGKGGGNLEVPEVHLGLNAVAGPVVFETWLLEIGMLL
jgi:hypothetical protein